MIGSPANRPQQKDWCIGQFGTRLSRGPEPIRFNRAAVCGNIVVPMQEPYAKELGLLYDASKIITTHNYQFLTNFDPEKDFQEDRTCVWLICRVQFRSAKELLCHSH